MKNRLLNWQTAFSKILIFAICIGPASICAQTKQNTRGVKANLVSELPSKEKRWALIIGIDEYANDVSTLKGSVNDAKALKNVLVNTAGFAENQIILLTTDSIEPSKRPTRENILGALNDLADRVPEDGLLLFSFSGHGVSVGNQAFLIPSNGRFTKNPALLKSFSIDVSIIKEIIEAIKVKQVLMLLDACRNEPGRGDSPNTLTSAYKSGFSFDVANSDVKAFATLYATSIGERAYEFYDNNTKQFRGYFSYAVEEGLKGKAANEQGKVTLSLLIDYLEMTVPKKVKFDKGENQIPSANYSETYRANQLILAVVKTPNSELNYDENYEQAIEQGNVARDERNYVAAENAYSRAEAMKFKDSRAIYGLGNIFTDQQRWEDAENAYRQAIRIEPKNPDAYVALSYVLAQPAANTNLTDRYAEAEKMARNAIQLDGKNAYAYDQLGVVLELRGMIGEETQNTYRKAIEIDKEAALPYAHLGRLFRRRGLIAESNSAYSEAIRLAADPPIKILVADVMQSQQRYADSEQLLRQALQEDPSNPTALFLLGRALYTRGEYEEAEKFLKKGIDISPKSFVYYILLSSLYMRLNKLAEAENTLMKTLDFSSIADKKRLSQEFESLGDLYMKADRKKDATRNYQQAISLGNDQLLLKNK